MSFEHKVIKEMNSQEFSSTGEGMRWLILQCRNRRDDKLWDELLSINMDADADAFLSWMIGHLEKEPLKKNHLGFWLESVSVYDEVQDEDLGAVQVNALLNMTDGTLDFVEWIENAYFNSAVICTIKDRIEDLEEINPEISLYDLADYAAAFGYCCLLGRHIGRNLPANLILPNGPRTVTIMAGFHDGDYLEVGRRTAEGWKRSTPKVLST